MSDVLSARTRATLFDGLRNGQDVATAAQAAGVGVREVFTAARIDTDLALLLAGTDPGELGAAGIVERAEYLRLLALGCTPSLSAQILFDGAGKAGGWRSEDPTFARACAVSELGTRRGARSRCGPRSGRSTASSTQGVWSAPWTTTRSSSCVLRHTPADALAAEAEVPGRSPFRRHLTGNAVFCCAPVGRDGENDHL
ncbi:hypothetical protein AB0O22_22965 [Streptomyces sp. NPDC091204]|uniref:hypothetical protein n=1 Tax=Streptomyces sp. NPDC091204 TaxID=3155299 RepID=UPI00341866ED